ncbi:hypothetical protein D3C80_1278390 [compost metagenome]
METVRVVDQAKAEIVLVEETSTAVEETTSEKEGRLTNQQFLNRISKKKLKIHWLVYLLREVNQKHPRIVVQNVMTVRNVVKSNN